MAFVTVELGQVRTAVLKMTFEISRVIHAKRRVRGPPTTANLFAPSSSPPAGVRRRNLTIRRSGADCDARARRLCGLQETTMGATFFVAAALILGGALVPGALVARAEQPQMSVFTALPADGKSCVTGDGKSGICVPNFQCNTDTNTINNDAFIDLRIGACPNFLQICCLKDEFVTGGEKEPENGPPPTCGWSNPGATEVRVKPGAETTADFGEFPWMVALLRNTAPEVEWSQDHFLGGGSIIHPSVVVTAAHKVDGLYENEVKCRAGEWDTKDDSELYPSQERPVKSIVTHDDFFRIQAYNNIALLFLEKPFTFRGAPHIGVACLGKKLPEPGTECFTMGWGKDFKGAYASTLKKINVPLVDFDVCQRRLRNTRLGSRFRLHPSLTCAGGEAGVDSCKGDGGSPLVCPISDPKKGMRYAIFGIVSSGVGCGKKGVPGAYVNIPYLYDWIVEVMKEEKLEKSSFTY
ncbi:unnamed protein product, partial [Iphiclides podalirius]